MSMFNECHIHLCDYTWLNVFSHAQFLLIKHKKIFEYFSCFWKVFCFCKNFKNSIALFWRLGHGSVQLHAPSREHHSENIHDSLASQSPSREKYLENFSKSRFLGFSQLILVTCLWVEAPVTRVTQKFLRLPSRLPRWWNFRSWKTLCTNFSKFRLKCLVAWPGDLHATSSSRENRVFCTIRVFFKIGFKIFSFFPRVWRLFILLSAFPSFKITVFTHKISIFSFTSSPIFKERYGFCFFLNIFYISCHIPLG